MKLFPSDLNNQYKGSKFVIERNYSLVLISFQWYKGQPSRDGSAARLSESRNANIVVTSQKNSYPAVCVQEIITYTSEVRPEDETIGIGEFRKFNVTFMEHLIANLDKKGKKKFFFIGPRTVL